MQETTELPKDMLSVCSAYACEMMKHRSSKRDLPPRSRKSPSEERAPQPPLLGDCDPKTLNLAPISIWIEDFSRVKGRIEEVRSSGFVDIRKYLDRHPQEVLDLAAMVRIVWVNDATLKLYDAKDRAALEGNLARIFCKESYGVFKNEIIALTEGRAEFVSEAINMTLSGHKKHVLLHLRVDPSCGHDLSRVCVAITDITSLKQAECALRKSEATYREVFKAAAIPMVVIDARTAIITNANASVEELLGLSPQELVGMHTTQLCPEDDKERCTELLNKLVGGTVSFADSLHLCRKDGREMCVIATARSVHFEGGTCVLMAFGQAGHAALSLDRRSKVDKRAASTVQRKLSERERLILTLIATGYTNKSIAERLRISIKTVESHRLRIMQKLDVHKVTDLVRYALASGLLVSE